MSNGRGSGRRAGQGGGGVDTCICPKCGHEEPHQRGTPVQRNLVPSVVLQ